MSLLGIIGGSGFCEHADVVIEEKRPIHTPFGEPSSLVWLGKLRGQPVAFLPRHGEAHTIAPHRINYRANIWALEAVGVSHIIAAAAVGGIGEQDTPGALCIPDQIIDYTHGREASFFDDDFTADCHLDFTYPYDAELRQALVNAASKLNIPVKDGGTYGAVQGPRLETAAEIKRMAQDGCDLVGMTGMPEAYLAREKGIAYATCAVVANKAAGLSEQLITMDEIHHNLLEGVALTRALIAEVIETQLG
jgi:5'-deoxy-5'-methylthioadenosine phosphorylase